MKVNRNGLSIKIKDKCPSCKSFDELLSALKSTNHEADLENLLTKMNLKDRIEDIKQLRCFDPYAPQNDLLTNDHLKQA